MVKLIPILADHSAVSPRTYFSKLRILLDFDSPTLVLSKMPVESVQLIGSHYIQITLHLIHIEEMAGNIEMHTSIGKTRLILDGNARKHPIRTTCGSLSEICGREHLADRLGRETESIYR